MLLFVHGLGEHSGRYASPAEYFVPRGLACWAFDYRGHGRSPGPRVHVRRFGEFLADLDAVRRVAEAEHAALPFFLVGHSQGGLIVLDYVLQRPERLAGVVVSSPLLSVHPDSRASPALEGLARVLSVLWPSLRFANNVDPALVSRDATVVEAYRNDPLVSRKVSARWFTELLAAMGRVNAGAPRLTLPALVMSSGADRLVEPEAARRWVGAAPRHLVEYVRWDGLYHEMFNEPERERIFERMEAWIEPRLPADPLRR